MKEEIITCKEIVRQVERNQLTWLMKYIAICIPT